MEVFVFTATMSDNSTEILGIYTRRLTSKDIQSQVPDLPDELIVLLLEDYHVYEEETETDFNIEVMTTKR